MLDGGTEEEECLTQIDESGKASQGSGAQVSEKKEEVARGGRGHHEQGAAL